MDSTSKLLIVLLIIASGDYFLYRILNLITWKVKQNKFDSRMEKLEIDKDLWEGRI